MTSARSRAFPVLVAVFSLWLLVMKDPLPLWQQAGKAIPAIAAETPIEQVGERGELSELVSMVARPSGGPIIFFADKGRDHRFRAFFASYVLFPQRLVYAVPEPSRPDFDWWTQCEPTGEAIGRLADSVSAESVVFWKTPIPDGFGDGRKVIALPDQRWVVYLR